ncbi:VWA domain-containing protein [Enterococcus durans]|uniref:SpaA isopeptide-forming pilin-related protein n=2 Tax=Enterococcus durans TaxID=53345 RepID=UPI000F4F733E|nr:SpaA isopeptide-forming pilin-related protein [Enterococcus durans]ROX83797.1 VWA domain-containing protein [Enterococcus durans]
MKKSYLFYLLGVIGIVFFIHLLFQSMEKPVEAMDGSSSEVLNNQYGEVTSYQTSDELVLETKVHANTEGRRFLLEIADKETKQPVPFSISDEYTEYSDLNGKTWVTTTDFFTNEIVKKFKIDWPEESEELEVSLQVQQQNENMLLSKPVKKMFSQVKADPNTQLTKETSQSSMFHTSTTKEQMKETAATTEETSEEKITKPFEAPVLSSLPSTKRVLDAIQPEYTTDETGVYPKAGWKPTGDVNVINHQGNKDASNHWDGLTDWDGDSDNKTNSYIEYGGTGTNADYAIRKFAKETTTPGLYDVFLNVRGNVQKEVAPLDIVLVVDWSGSMNEEHRLTEVRRGINNFIDTLDHSGVTDKINLGYVGYSSNGYSYSNAELPIAPFDSVKDQVKNLTPLYTQGGTFTQKALREAGNMLSNNNGHEKIIVLLTDGVPTFSYQVTKVHTEEGKEYYGTVFSDREDQPGNTSLIARPMYAQDQYGENKLINSTFIATIGEAMALKEKGIEIHGLGIQLQGDEAAGLSKTQVEAKMRKMVSQDANGEFYYESAAKASDISDYLTKKAIHLSGTISNGQVNDPIAQPFIYEEHSLEVKDVGTNSIEVMPKVTIDGTTIKSNQIYLGKDQEIQIHYQVRIQTEGNTFQPDHWYQMNERTTLQPLSESSELAEFGIPSAKAPGVKLNFTKQWEEFDHDKSSRPDHVMYEVKRTQTADPNSWQTAFVQLNKPASDTGDTWTRNDVVQLSEKSGAGYQENVFLPKYNNQGKDFTYQAITELDVPGYTSKQLDNTTWKNTKQFTPLNVKVIKQSSSGEQPLEGAIFQLKGGTLDVTLKDNHDGTYSLPDNARLDKGEPYTLTEVKAPKGHELSQKQIWTIKVSDEGKVTIDNKDTSIKDDTITLTVTNQFKKIPIGIRKYTTQEGKQVNLAKATFDLQKKSASGDYQTKETKETDTDGFALLEVNEPGEYRMVETKGPEGYDTIPGNYMFTIDKYGEIHYDGNNVETADQWTLTHENHLKPFDLTVHKKEDNGKALPGAKFRLQGNGVDIELPKEGQATDTFLFENLQPGTYTLTETYTPEGYQGLKQSVTVVIQEDGTVTINGTVVEDVLVDGDDNNQISLDVTNKAKVPLPETGGSGRIGVYLAGAIALGISGVYLFMRNHGKDVMK